MDSRVLRHPIKRTVHQPIEQSNPLEVSLWVIGVLFFGFGDLLTTIVGLELAGLSEADPIAAMAIRRFGVLGMVGLKLGVFGGCYVLWRYIPRPIDVAVPLGLALLGPLLTGWNLLLLVFVFFS